MSPSIFSSLAKGLSKTRDALVGKFDAVFRSKQSREDMLDEIEAALLGADLGVSATQRIMDSLQTRTRKGEALDQDGLTAVLQEELSAILSHGSSALAKAPSPPTVIMVVGVNGTGKTTSIAKLASMLQRNGNKVVLGAADTFRAAATDQIEVWGSRLGCDVIAHQAGADPAAVAFDAIHAARARKADYLILDTAGRLHTKVNLMEEVKKIRRILSRENDGAPHEVLLVLDATTGQNAVSQAKVFQEATSVTGIVLTKLDGTAKGGIVVAISSDLGIPVKFIGVGEGIDDLRPFEPRDFVRALLAE